MQSPGQNSRHRPSASKTVANLHIALTHRVLRELLPRRPNLTALSLFTLEMLRDDLADLGLEV
jgi:hypothetical protein